MAHPAQVEQLQDQTQLVLQEYCKTKCAAAAAAAVNGASHLRFGRLLLALPPLLWAPSAWAAPVQAVFFKRGGGGGGGGGSEGNRGDAAVVNRVVADLVKQQQHNNNNSSSSNERI